MNKGTIGLYIILCFLPYAVFSCDHCACSIGVAYPGIVPQFNKHSIGLEYNVKKFTTHHSSILPVSNYTSDENFQSFTVHSKINFGKKLQVFGFLPYAINEQKERGVTNRINGLGDLSLFSLFSAFASNDSFCNAWKYNFQFGGGVKLPTGIYTTLGADQELNPNLQAGTGSVDFMLSQNSYLRSKSFGLNLYTVYKINSSNSEHFRFGNRLVSALQTFYLKDLRKFTLMPSLGATIDVANKNTHNGFVVSNSGSDMLSGLISCSVYYKNLIFSSQFMLPLFQNNKDDVVASKSDLKINISYNF